MKLSPKQEQFCKEYLIDLNATQAAIRQGTAKKQPNNKAFSYLRKLQFHLVFKN
jgi:phage terminase small subunit